MKVSNFMVCKPMQHTQEGSQNFFYIFRINSINYKEI